MIGAETIEAREDRDRQGDREQVGHEEEEGATGDGHGADGEAVACDGKGRHQGGRDGDADNGFALALDDGIATGQTREDGDEQVEEVRPCAGDDFGRDLGQRRQADDQERDGDGGEHTQRHGEDGAAEGGKVEDAERETHQHDRAHQG